MEEGREDDGCWWWTQHGGVVTGCVAVLWVGSGGPAKVVIMGKQGTQDKKEGGSDGGVWWVESGVFGGG